MRLIGYIIVNTAALLITAFVVPGFFISDITTAIIAAVVIGVINTFIKPIIHLISLPLTILTLGLFSVVINILLLMLAAEITPGFQITNIVAAIIGSIVLSVVSSFLSMFTK